MIHSDISPSIESDRNSRETERCQVASRRGYVTTKRKAYVRSDRGVCNVVGSRTMCRGRVVWPGRLGSCMDCLHKTRAGSSLMTWVSARFVLMSICCHQVVVVLAYSPIQPCSRPSNPLHSCRLCLKSEIRTSSILPTSRSSRRTMVTPILRPSNDEP